MKSCQITLFIILSLLLALLLSLLLLSLGLMIDANYFMKILVAEML